MTSTTTRQVYATIAKKSKANGGGATGADTISHLQAIEDLLGRPLRALVTECDLCSGLLFEHFRSPLARKGHVKAVVAAMKLGALPKTPEAEARWASALAAASDEEKLVRERILHVLARSPKKASQETLARYANSLAQALSKLNALDPVAVVDPGSVEKLRAACTSRNTFQNHATVVLIFFDASPGLKENHPESHQAWTKAVAAEKERSLKESRSNAPSSSRQAENFVTMHEWRRALATLEEQADPHATLRASQIIVWITYTCTVPPKRADLGALRVFDSEPSKDEVERHPNHVVLAAEPKLVVGQFKTSKNRDPIVEVLPLELLEVVHESLDRHPRTHLFENAKGEPFTRKGFSKCAIAVSNGLFGRGAGPSLLRHAFCTDLDFNRLTLAQRDEIAERMGHSSAQQEQYRFLTLQPNSEYRRISL